ALRKRPDVDRSPGAVIEVRPFGRRRFIAPRKVTLATGRGIERGRYFPFGLGWQPPAGPAAVRFGFIPADADDRMPRIERGGDAESALIPALVATAVPEQRVRGSFAAAPVP